MSHSSYKSIEQLRHLNRDICHYFEEGKRPVIEFTGTIKLHGTNAGIGYNNNEFWCQSRSNIITVKQDNMGFAFFVESNKVYLIDIIKNIAANNMIDLNINSIILFGEWCGTGIQKGVAISKLPKMFVVFDVKIVPIQVSIDDNETSYYLNTTIPEVVSNSDLRIFNIYDFPLYKVTIDFNNIKQAEDTMVHIIKEVESCCPFGKQLGVEGVGEGVVFKHYYNERNRYIFKLKGDEHKVSKEKKIIEIDPVMLASVNEFCDRTVTMVRFLQAIDMIYNNNPALPTYHVDPEMKHVSKIINWMRDDIFKEEMDVMIASKLEPSDVFPEIAKRTTAMFKAHMC